jgi:ElaB/YqjD/DUF883 family membrane-anchored ribosome-binding protein
MKIDKISLDNYITGNYGEERSDKMVLPNNDYRIDPMKKDILKLIDKVEDLEQMLYNCNAKRRDEYKLINDRINELLERLLAIERELRE